MGLLDGLRGFKFNARKAAIGSFSHYFHQRKLEKLKNVELAKSGRFVNRTKRMDGFISTNWVLLI